MKMVEKKNTMVCKYQHLVHSFLQQEVQEIVIQGKLYKVKNISALLFVFGSSNLLGFKK